MALYAIYTFDTLPATINTGGEVDVYDDPNDQTNLITARAFNKISDLLEDGFYYLNPLLVHPLLHVYLDAQFKTSLLNNDAGFITNVITALGYTPYNSTNPNGYISGITSTQVTNALGYTPTTNARTLTINGTTHDLTANRTWNINLPTSTISNNVSRSLSNTAGSTNQFTISSTRDCLATYSITMNFAITALLASSASVFLEYSTNGGSSWITISQCTTSFNLGLSLSGANDMSLSGYIPANALVRLRPATTNATCTYQRGQEVLIN